MEQERATEAKVSTAVKAVIEIQALLGNLTDTVRADFLSGENGACKLTEEELAKLDKLFALCNTYEERTGKLSDQIRWLSTLILVYYIAIESINLALKNWVIINYL